MDSLTTKPEPPLNPVFVLSNGIRVPLHMRYRFYDPQHGHIWEPVIEGDVAKLMGLIVRIDATHWPKACHVLLPSVGPTAEADLAWAQRIIENSPVLKAAETRGCKVQRD